MLPQTVLVRRYLAGLSVGLVATCLLLSCGGINTFSSTTPTAQSNSVAPARGTLRFAHALGWGGNESLDPISSSPLNEAIMLLYSRLVRKNGAGVIEGEIADKWQTNENATIWTFTLQPNILFHNGTVLTADDVVFSFERIFDPALDSPLATVFNMIQRVEAIDEQTVTFYLNSTKVDFPLLLTDRRIRILPMGAGEKVALGIGSGPFQLDLLDVKGITRFRAFDRYWEGAPGLAAVELVALPGSSSQAQALLVGQLDYVNGLSAAESALFDGRDDFQRSIIPTGNWQGIVFHTDVEPFTDQRVRKALRLVADRQAMVDLTLGHEGGTVACDSPFAPRDLYYTPLDCPQDIAAARRLLAAAGFSDGITVTLTTADLGTGWLALGELYQYQAAQAGIHVILKQVSADGYWSNNWLVDPVFMTTWLERPAAQILAEAYRSDAKWNESHWRQPEFDRLVDAAAGARDLAKRKEIYATIQQVLWNEGGTLIPYHLNQIRVVKCCVQGIPPINQYEIRWHQVTKLE